MYDFIYSFQHSFVKKTKFSKDGAPYEPEFDYVVVGGGPAGCALATRLLEGGSFSVLLIEQGTAVEENPEFHNTINNILQTRSLHGSSIDYSYIAENEGQFNPKMMKISSGKILGGSSCINFAIWTRGAAADYNMLAETANNEDFKWDNMVPFFEKVENTSAGSSGPIPVRLISSTKRDHYWTTTSASSLEHVGFKQIVVNGGDILGYGMMSECLDDKGRANANMYLNHVATDEKRKTSHGFEVWTSLRADKVVFGIGEDGIPIATGVATPFGFIRAKREVILTAGAIQSPHLLLLSGVGPSEQLNDHGIPVVLDSPEVGQNLWDHSFVDILAKLRPEKRRDTVEDFGALVTSRKHVTKWATTRTGLMTGLLFDWIAFTSLNKEIETALEGSKDIPNLTTTQRNLLLNPSIPNIEQFIHYGHGLAPAPDPIETSYIAITNVLLTPLSRGSVSLAASDHNPISNSSGNTTDRTSAVDSRKATATWAPKIVVNQMKETLDREMMVQALQKAYAILGAPAWQEHLQPMLTPSRDELLEIIKDKVSTLWHLGGTCAMRTKGSPGVVDNKFRVQGVHNLRVADLSVIPFPVTAHTQALAYVLGEKAAEFIKQDFVS